MSCAGWIRGMAFQSRAADRRPLKREEQQYERGERARQQPRGGRYDAATERPRGVDRRGRGNLRDGTVLRHMLHVRHSRTNKKPAHKGTGCGPRCHPSSRPKASARGGVTAATRTGLRAIARFIPSAPHRVRSVRAAGLAPSPARSALGSNLLLRFYASIGREYIYRITKVSNEAEAEGWKPEAKDADRKAAGGRIRRRPDRRSSGRDCGRSLSSR